MGDKGRLVELDALRGLAALAVVLFHLTTRYGELYGHADPPPFEVPWGHFGVQLFFGLSGFVIFMTLERTRRPMDFIVSRVSRLYPAYWAAILLTTLAVTFGGMTSLQQPGWVIAVNVTMLQGFMQVPPVDGVYWTLTIELAFYAIMFAVYLTKQLGRIDSILFGWIALKWLWWAVPALSWTLGLLLIQAYVPFFAIGIASYLVFAGRRTVAQIAPLVVFALATVGVIDGLDHLAVAVLVAGLFLGFANRKLGWLGWGPLAWLGTISYTLYLLHENIGFTLQKALQGAGMASAPSIALTLAASLLLASAVTYAIERPAMRVIRRWWAARQAR
jgi:peptidoglycan/LPS O-acetylase OafA/YrhL